MTEVNSQSQLPTIESVEDVAVGALLARVRELAEQQMRFITATCLDKGENIEVFYHFDRQMVMHHLRVVVAKGSQVPSISEVYLCAFLVENEMKELFGLEVTGLAVDYQGKLMLSENSPKLPMLKVGQKPEQN